MIVEIPIQIPSLANLSGHWTKKFKIKKLQYKVIRLFIKRKHFVGMSAPIRIALVRISPRQLDDDNLHASMKYIIDCISDIIHPGLAPGRADGIGDIEFTIKQEKGSPSRLRVEIL